MHICDSVNDNVIVTSLSSSHHGPSCLIFRCLAWEADTIPTDSFPTDAIPTIYTVRTTQYISSTLSNVYVEIVEIGKKLEWVEALNASKAQH